MRRFAPGPAPGPLRHGVALLLLVGLLALDPEALDPAAVKLPLLTLGLAALLGLSTIRTGPLPARGLDAAVAVAVPAALLLTAAAPYPGRARGAVLRLLLVAGGYVLARRELGHRDLGRPLAWLGGLTATLALLELILPVPWRTGAGGSVYPAGELVGPLANPNLTASLLLLCLPIALARSRGLAGLLLLPALVGTLSRAALVGLGVQAGLWLWLRRGQGRVRRRVLAATLLVAGVLAAGHASGRLDLGQVLRSRTLESRLELWRLLAGQGANRPWLGHGPGSTGVVYGMAVARRGRPGGLPDRVDFAHNPFLAAWVEGGLVGLLLLCALAVLTLRAMSRRLRGNTPAPALGLAGLLVAELVGVGLETAYLALVVALVVGTLEPRGEGGRGQGAGAALLVALLLAFLPVACEQARAERARRELRRQVPGGLDAAGAERLLVDHRRTPEELHDAAAAAAMGGHPFRARARLLLLEALYPGYGSSRQSREQLRAMLGARAPPRQGPAPLPPLQGPAPLPPGP